MDLNQFLKEFPQSPAILIFHWIFPNRLRPCHGILYRSNTFPCYSPWHFTTNFLKNLCTHAAYTSLPPIHFLIYPHLDSAPVTVPELILLKSIMAFLNSNGHFKVLIFSDFIAVLKIVLSRQNSWFPPLVSLFLPFSASTFSENGMHCYIYSWSCSEYCQIILPSPTIFWTHTSFCIRPVNFSPKILVNSAHFFLLLYHCFSDSFHQFLTLQLYSPPNYSPHFHLCSFLVHSSHCIWVILYELTDVMSLTTTFKSILKGNKLWDVRNKGIVSSLLKLEKVLYSSNLNVCWTDKKFKGQRNNFSNVTQLCGSLCPLCSAFILVTKIYTCWL